jgi:hypothetical protein
VKNKLSPRITPRADHVSPAVPNRKNSQSLGNKTNLPRQMACKLGSLWEADKDCFQNPIAKQTFWVDPQYETQQTVPSCSKNIAQGKDDGGGGVGERGGTCTPIT